jgi:hypothetical protein
MNMDKVAIVGHGVGCPMILIAETKGNEITDVQLEELAKRSHCHVSQIEIVPKEDFEARAKELGQTYTITQHPDVPPIPEIHLQDVNTEYERTKNRTYTKSDEIAYQNKIARRRKKNKNKKTHRK